MAEREIDTEAYLFEQNAMLRKNAHKMAHDLKNPLSAGREFICLILDGMGGPTTEAQREFLHTVLECCDKINETVETWLEGMDAQGEDTDRRRT